MKIFSAAALTSMYFFVASAAFAGASARAPEVDPGSLASIASGITGAYIAYRMFRARRSLKNTK